MIRRRVAGAFTAVDDLPYLPGEHLWWRFREDAGQTFWETSPDGERWTIGAQVQTPISVTALDVLLEMGRSELGPSPSRAEVRFDSLNMS